MDSLMGNSLTQKAAGKAMDGAVGKDTCCPDMGFTVRVICFLGMFVFGLILVFIGCMGLKNNDEPDYSIGRFIIPYIIGFALALGGTFFLAGFKAQIKKMFEKERRIATITVLATFVLILVFGFATENAVICIILLIIQFIGIFWYVSSMIPGFKKFFCCCCRQIKTASAAAGAV